MNWRNLTRTTLLATIAAAASAYLASGVLRLAFDAPSAEAHQASNFTSIQYLNDYWNNYDGDDSSNADWPLRFVFYGNAEVDLIKDRLDGCGGDPTISPGICNDTVVSSENFGTGDNIDNGGQGSWVGYDTDKGLKETVGCNWYYHFRVYARSDTDHNYNPDYGFYVFMTVHQDYETAWPGCQPNRYRSYESTENAFLSRAQSVAGWVTHSNLSYQYNYQPNAEWSPNSYVESNGYVSYVYVP